MDQSKSNNITAATPAAAHIPLPKRSFTLEFFVGLFTMAAVAAAGYLAVGLGELKLFGSNQYQINAEFDNISGLQAGASVEIAGVQIGEVGAILLKDPEAIVVMNIANNVQIRDDDIASIRTKGIIGDRYVKISRGASDTYIKPGGVMTETESVVDIEDIIGKIVHSLTGDDKESKDSNAKTEGKS